MGSTTPRGISVLAVLATAVFLSFVSPPAQAGSLTPAVHGVTTAVDNDALGERLSEKFLSLLKSKDRDGLKNFLSPAFQLQRVNGVGTAKAAYLKDLPSIGEFVVSNVVATRTGDTLVARYLANVEGVVDGQAYSPGVAPRISTFQRSGGRWQLVSHANFNALQGEAAAPGVEVLLSKAMATTLGQPLVYPESTPAQLSSSILTLAPGQQTGWHLHDAPLYFYVMSGSVEVSYEGGITKTYDAGTAVIEAIETPHNGRNPGATDTVVLVVNIGAEGVPNTVTL